MPTALDSPSRNATAATERFDAIVRLPFAFIGVRTHDARVEEICFLPGDVQPRPPANALAQRVVDQLLAYCADSSTAIDLPLAIEGTYFQRRVWDQIARIPAGSTATYGELARRLNGEARAVGQACGDNRLAPRDSLSPRRCGFGHRRVRTSSRRRVRGHQALAADARSRQRIAFDVSTVPHRALR